MTDTERGTTPIGDEKVMSDHKEHMIGDIAHGAAERGQLATDEHGQPLVEFDKAAESRLRLKIDLYIIPPVALMYLFCFIDRANVGMRLPPLFFSLSIPVLINFFPWNRQR